jgi:iron complex transport system substrate-binding protein
MRIASLLASATELVCELGAGDELVARSHECNYPDWVKRLPCASQPTFDITGSSKQIDALVRERLAAGKPLYAVDDALLLELQPDVIITQTHCEVCAVSPSNVGGELCRKQVAALSTGTLAGILDSFRQIARVIGRDVEPMIARIEARLAEVARILAGAPRPTIACLEWIEPIFNMGNWGPELVERSGGIQLLGTPGAHSTTTRWEAVLDGDPDYLLIAPCGFGLSRTLSEMHVMEALSGWRDLRAVREGRVFVADGDRYFNRSSPSVFGSIEILAEILHPDRFPPAHAASWQRYVSRG